MIPLLRIFKSSTYLNLFNLIELHAILTKRKVKNKCKWALIEA